MNSVNEQRADPANAFDVDDARLLASEAEERRHRRAVDVAVHQADAMAAALEADG